MSVHPALEAAVEACYLLLRNLKLLWNLWDYLLHTHKKDVSKIPELALNGDRQREPHGIWSVQPFAIETTLASAEFTLENTLGLQTKS